MFFASDTGPIGFIMNVLATASFCCTASFVYKKVHTKKGAIVGLTLGVIMLTAVMLLWNYLITPIYQACPGKPWPPCCPPSSCPSMWSRAD